MTDQPVRQYQILFKRGGHPDWAKLEPGVHASLYGKEEVTAGIEVLRANPAFKAIVVRIENDLFNIVTFEQPAIAPQAFTF